MSREKDVFVELPFNIIRACMFSWKANKPSGMNFNIFMAPSNIHGLGLLNDDEVPTQSELVQTTVPAINFRRDEYSIRLSK